MIKKTSTLPTPQITRFFEILFWIWIAFLMGFIATFTIAWNQIEWAQDLLQPLYCLVKPLWTLGILPVIFIIGAIFKATTFKACLSLTLINVLFGGFVVIINYALQ